MAKDKKETLQWHPAFYAGIQIEFEDEADKLIFENEHQLGTKPKEIDVLIIKKRPDVQIQKNLGKIFRTHNLIEYKSPTDTLNIDDFYKVYGYACFYKSDTAAVDEIRGEEITITFVCKRFPRNLIQKLLSSRKLTLEKVDNGIHYLRGDHFPIQIVVTSQLSAENNFWLKNLTNDLKDRSIPDMLFRKYQPKQHNILYKSVMNIIIRANNELFRREKTMCEALMELMQEEMDALREQCMTEGRAKGMAEGMAQGITAGKLEGVKELVRKKLSKGKSIEEIADALEESVEAIEEIIRNM